MFIQRALKRCFSKDFFPVQRVLSNFSSHSILYSQLYYNNSDLSFSLTKPNKTIDDKIEDNITQKINSMQFKALKEVSITLIFLWFFKDIFNSQEANSYHNTEVLRLIILKSLQKKNISFASEVFEDMMSLEIVPDDATYTALMESLLYEGSTEEAFELYIQVNFY